MVKLIVTLPGGETQTIEATEEASLMEALRDGGTNVTGTCGGMCSCGSCHIYASAELLKVAPPIREDEQDMLDALAEIVEVKPNSRLSCQIKVGTALENMKLKIAPEI